MSDPSSPAPSGPPEVDHPELARALAEIDDLDAQPLAEHHERLRAVHEAMHTVLNPSAD